ncbi:DNA ligase 4 isoform X2 [Momordica charantia]|uniref:DNA ligase n=1 Tax=Momordica charantia TaxID=3673 RepID=A0A6J1D7W8_MOMCH|nr:DNA ligase 4 isoform X2 [Momordica charantia]
MTELINFNVLSTLFDWIQRSKSSAKKRSKFRKFLDTFCSSADYFSAIRLILPTLDRERGTYGLKESVLATCLIDALGISRDSDDALRLNNWRKGGAKTGANAGNFALVAAEVLQRRQGMTPGGLTIKELNDLLDRLALSENSRAEKTAVLSTLIQKTNAQEMKWIVMIILKDLKLGVSEKSIFHEFHPDAEDLFNVTCDLKLVCEKLRDRRKRHKRQDIEVGKAVRPQLASRVSNANAAWKKLHGKEVVVECKFDGDRIQIHKNGTEIHFFSRNFLDHSEYGRGMSDVIVENIIATRCILDGEMLVWDKSLNRFAEFGSNQEIARAAKDGLDSDRQLCYVAFDVLYVGDTSVIHRSLKERHELLRDVVKPVKGRLEILVPNGGLNSDCAGDPSWSQRAYNADDVERFFKNTIENRDEGIVIKDMGSKWEPGDRSGKWLKLKPDYVRAGSDLDALIIGGYYGSGRRGGEVAQFLMGLAERSPSNAYPRRFISFCRVGTGLTDEDLDAVTNKLRPYFRKSEYPKKAAPSFYQVTNNSKERPDVWIESPEKSIILSITSDIRTIKSEVFAAPYSLRFPRIDRVRYDKPWHECLDVQSFVELVHSSNGNTQRGTDNSGWQDSNRKFIKSTGKRRKKSVSVVPSHLLQTDISGIKEDSLIFSNMLFYIVNVPPTHSLDSLHRLIVENGGTFSMNLNDSVTHSVAADTKGIKYEAARRRGDVIHYSWMLECCSQKKLLPLQPKHFLFLSDHSKKKLEEEIDAFSDSYFWDLELADLKQLLSNVSRSEDVKAIDYYRGKYCPKDEWSIFVGFQIYFLPLRPSLKFDWDVLLELSMRRLKVEVSFRGGKVSDNHVSATHVVVFCIPGSSVDCETVLKCFNEAEKHVILKNKIHIVAHQWLEDCLERAHRLQEDAYSLKPNWKKSIEKLNSDIDSETPLASENTENQKISSPSNAYKDQGRNEAASGQHMLLHSTERSGGKKRGKSTARSMQKGKLSVEQVRRARARTAKGPAKISEVESDSSDYNDEKTNAETENIGTPCSENLKTNELTKLENFDPSRKGKGIEHVPLCSTERTGEKKRGRRPTPTASARSMQKGKAGVEQGQRTRARTAKGSAKIGGVESDSSDTTDDKTNAEGNGVEKRNIGTVCPANSNTNEFIWPENCDSSHKGKVIEQDDLAEFKSNVPEIEISTRYNCQGIEESEKLEVMTDPLQAMLLDMVPSLGMSETKSSSTVLEEKQPVQNNSEPTKKKVSYKDVASELLKDW